VRCFWKHSPLKWWFLAFASAGFLVILYLAYFQGSSSTTMSVEESAARHSLTYFLLNVLPFTAVVVLMVCVHLFRTQRAFKKNTYRNLQLTYILQNSGIHQESSLVQSTMKWEVFSRACENQNGFILNVAGSNSLIWIPKSGFTTIENIDQCRELFRQHVKNSKRLFPA
jgi:hypothetical protein